MIVSKMIDTKLEFVVDTRPSERSGAEFADEMGTYMYYNLSLTVPVYYMYFHMCSLAYKHMVPRWMPSLLQIHQTDFFMMMYLSEICLN